MSHSNTEKQTSTAYALRRLSTQDLYYFGIHHIAYIRPVNIQNQKLYAVHAANGEQIQILNTIRDAIATARHNDLEPVFVH